MIITLVVQGKFFLRVALILSAMVHVDSLQSMGLESKKLHENKQQKTLPTRGQVVEYKLRPRIMEKDTLWHPNDQHLLEPYSQLQQHIKDLNIKEAEALVQKHSALLHQRGRSNPLFTAIEVMRRYDRDARFMDTDAALKMIKQLKCLGATCALPVDSAHTDNVLFWKLQDFRHDLSNPANDQNDQRSLRHDAHLFFGVAIAAGADINHRDSWGRSLLHRSCGDQRMRPEEIEVLFNHNINVTLPDHKGRTAWNYLIAAHEGDEEEVARFTADWNAKVDKAIQRTKDKKEIAQLSTMYAWKSQVEKRRKKRFARARLMPHELLFYGNVFDTISDYC